MPGDVPCRQHLTAPFETLIDSLDRARDLTATNDHLADETEQQLGAFVGVRTVAPGLQPNPFAQQPPPPAGDRR